MNRMHVSTALTIMFLCTLVFAQEPAIPGERIGGAPSAGHSGPDRTQPSHVEIEIRTVTLPDDLLNRLAAPRTLLTPKTLPLPAFPDHAGTPDGEPVIIHQARSVVTQDLPVSSFDLSAEQHSDLIRELQANPEASILLAPRVRINEGQTGTISDITRIHWSMSSDPERDAGNLREVLEGTEMTLQPVCRDSGQIELDVSIRLYSAEKDSQIPKDANGVLLAAPKQHCVSLDVSLTVADGGHRAIVTEFANDVLQNDSSPAPRGRARLISRQRTESRPPQTVLWLISAAKVND